MLVILQTDKNIFRNKSLFCKIKTVLTYDIDILVYTTVIYVHLYTRKYLQGYSKQNCF